MKNLFFRLLDLMIDHRWHFIAQTMLSTVVSIADRRRTAARWDGEHWEFVWADGCLFSTTPRIRPRVLTEQNIGDYLAHYTPSDGDTVLEVGAGLGTEVCTFSRMLGPSGTVIAVEADPSAVRLLEKQAAKLANRNVRVIPVAAGATEGTATLSITTPTAVGNSTVTEVGGATLSVRQMPLHAVLAELGITRVDYMKVNIEGAEYDALVGLGSALRNISRMCISCHDFTGVPAQRTYDKVYELLVSQGLEVTAGAPEPSHPWSAYYLFARWPSPPSHGVFRPISSA